MPEITPLAPTVDQWRGTYDAVLNGILNGLVQWAARGITPITDTQVDAFVIRAQGVATRAANRMWGSFSQSGAALPVPSDDGWDGDFLQT